jgi:hypothetical protein
MCVGQFGRLGTSRRRNKKTRGRDFQEEELGFSFVALAAPYLHILLFRLKKKNLKPAQAWDI